MMFPSRSVAMMALGMGVGASKALLRGEDLSDKSMEWWAGEGIDRSGMSGILRTPLNLVRYAAAVGGYTDAIPSRYMGRELEGLFVSPTASVMGHAGRAAFAMGEGDHKRAADHAMKATPFINNTWHIREVLTRLGDS